MLNFSLFKKKNQAVRQLNSMDCGPSCLLYICNYHNKEFSLEFIRKITYTSKNGVNLLSISEAAKTIGFSVKTGKITLDKLINSNIQFPSIIHWDGNHFVVLKNIVNRKNKLYFEIMDPRFGNITLNEKQFKNSWCDKENRGIIALFEPTKEFYNFSAPKPQKSSINDFIKYLKPHKKKFIKLILLVFVSSLITLIFPFLTKELIDKGITDKNINVIQLILLAQLSLFLGNMTINIFRNWFTLYIGTKISISLIEDFIIKLVKLPMIHFENQMIGDLNQRIIDNERIERLITSESVSIFFSIISFVVFSIILFYFNVNVLIIYFTLTSFSVIWSIFWLKKRKILDFFEFQIKARNQESIFEIFSGIRDLKLYQFEEFKVNKWKKIQDELFNLNIKSLKIDQIQITGYHFINQLKNIIVTYLAATLVLKGSMTLGTLLSISFIIGEMNGPIGQFIGFLRKIQDGKLSFERLSEITHIKNEEKENYVKLDEIKNNTNNGIILDNVSFSYGNPSESKTLHNISTKIEFSKVTAIVGHSGSGKTTLMKLLLRFYEPNDGKILFNNFNLSEISPMSLRMKIGTVLQDGFIFSETIERNIATHDKEIDNSKLYAALEMACIDDFVKSLPKKEKTIIGSLGNSISNGQKQRILIARAIYKNPEYLFLDEATSSLDSLTERKIHNNLQTFYKNRTVLIIAHRLSTVINADKIIVIQNGKIVEEGKHQELVKNKSFYYELVKNQIEINKE